MSDKAYDGLQKELDQSLSLANLVLGIAVLGLFIAVGVGLASSSAGEKLDALLMSVVFLAAILAMLFMKLNTMQIKLGLTIKKAQETEDDS